MDKTSKPYKSGEYRDIFDAAEMTSLAAEELVAYSDSYYKMVEIRDIEKTALEKGETKGRMEGLQEGRMEGLQEGRMKGLQEGRMEGREGAYADIVRNMHENGFSVDSIVQATKLSPGHIKRILES